MVLEGLQAEIKYNHVPYIQRFSMFMNRTRVRFTVVLFLFNSFTYWGNLVIFQASKLERSFKKWKKSYILSTYPVGMGWKSAIETTVVPKTLSQTSVDRIGEIFVKMDRQLPSGVN